MKYCCNSGDTSMFINLLPMLLYLLFMFS